jgi:hypothetical protein
MAGKIYYSGEGGKKGHKIGLFIFDAELGTKVLPMKVHGRCSAVCVNSFLNRSTLQNSSVIAFFNIPAIYHIDPQSQVYPE